MKAAIYTRYGGPEVVSIKELPIPQITPDQLLIKVHTTTVNRTDTGFRSAQYVVSRLFSGLWKPKKQILGCEFAGEIVETGANISKYNIGDRVFGFDDRDFGGHAEFKCLSERGAIGLIPSNLTYTEAAALTEGSHYALVQLRAAKIKPGDHVLVYGATGAIGSAAVQLLKEWGAVVVAVSNSKNVELVRSLGADEVIDYQTQDFRRTAHRFDLVLDAVGKSSFGICKTLLKPKGVYISTELGHRGENVWRSILTRYSKGKRILFPIPSITPEDVTYLARLAEKGAFKPVIDRHYPLSEIVEAHRYVDTGSKTGNVVITMQ